MHMDENTAQRALQSFCFPACDVGPRGVVQHQFDVSALGSHAIASTKRGGLAAAPNPTKRRGKLGRAQIDRLRSARVGFRVESNALTLIERAPSRTFDGGD